MIEPCRHAGRTIRVPCWGRPAWPSPRCLCIDLMILLFFVSCEKVIEVELNKNSPVLVVEGHLSYNTPELEVRVTRTGNYFDITAPGVVEDAGVYLEDPSGGQWQAGIDSSGVYRLSGLHPEPGVTYTLRVEDQGKSYTAQSTLPMPVRIDSIGYEYNRETRFLESGYRLLVFFSDPVSQQNYYRIRISRNGEETDRLGDLIVFDDSDFNGMSIQVRLRRQAFLPGDTAQVDLLSIDQSAWRYFTTLREVSGLNPGSPAPANPASNFDQGVLGYFSAWSGSGATIIIE